MLVPMTRVQILGHRTDLEQVLGSLQRLGLVELADARAARALEGVAGAKARSARREQLRLLADRIDGLWAKLPGKPRGSGPATGEPVTLPLPVDDLRAEVDGLTQRVEIVDRQLDALRDERLLLPDYLAPLAVLVPLVPELAELDAGELRSLRLSTAALVLNTDDDGLVEALRAELATVLGTRFELVWTRVEAGAMGCLVVFPRDEQDAVHALLGGAQVRSVALPGRFERLSLHAAVRGMQRRLQEIPAALAAVEAERRRILLPHAPRLAAVRAAIAAELERLDATERLGVTRRGFLASCWVPRDQLDRLRTELDSHPSPVAVEEVATAWRDPAAPVLMRNARLARPFEPLVRFLDLPRAGSVDPTLLMTLGLPLMFGAMVGDVGYGVVLLAAALLARRLRPSPGPELASLTWLLLAGAGCSIVFGVLFGEFFGDLGRRLIGDFAVWQYRADAAALEPLLLLAVLAGAVHVVLGLTIGAWQAIRSREYRVLLDKLGMLLALAGLFGVAGQVAGRVPAAVAIASAAAIIGGLALIMSLHGALGVATGPLDFLGRIGNILSYLRLAAVGLASAHLAGVANELGAIGPIWMGVFVAGVFHILNVALASFSPTIQALRLHYVEFFGAFFLGGGLAFKPFGRELQQATAAT
jgi:V/A-type H+/Na+-transporting ATPase subunit I